MLKTKVTKQTVQQAVEYHAQDNKGLAPVIEGDSDLIDWLRYVLADVGGLSEEEAAALTITVTGDEVAIGGNSAVMDAVRMELL